MQVDVQVIHWGEKTRVLTLMAPSLFAGTDSLPLPFTADGTQGLTHVRHGFWLTVSQPFSYLLASSSNAPSNLEKRKVGVAVRNLRACKKIPRKQDSLVTFLFKNRNLFLKCVFMLLPGVTDRSVYFGLFTTTGYCYCLNTTCSLSLWLSTADLLRSLLMWPFLTPCSE